MTFATGDRVVVERGIDSVIAWEAAAWDATVARSILVKAWRRQQMEAGMQGGWRGVRGSAGACTMSMKRAG